MYKPIIVVPGKDKIIELPACVTLKGAVINRNLYIKENLGKHEILRNKGM
jgi:hypothetical protein